MYQFTLLTVGSMKPGPHKTLLEGYVTRLKPFAKWNEIEVKPEPFKDEADRERALEEEARRIIAAIPTGAAIVVVDAEGKHPTSEMFADWVQGLAEQETRNIVFIVGGPLGLAMKIKQLSNERIALSKQTYPHDLAIVMLGEQLYRAMTILHGKTYHY